MTEQSQLLLTLATNVRLFAGIPMPQLEKLLKCADKITIAPNALFFNEGDIGHSFYILLIGHVAVEQSKNGQWINLATLHPGDSFGEMALVDAKSRSARVRANTECTALFFNIDRLSVSSDITSALYHNIAKVLVTRLRDANNVVLDLTCQVNKPRAAGLMRF
jgi:CRP/FNR family transcriptional regulator, cyclic AMP receptor protein